MRRPKARRQALAIALAAGVAVGAPLGYVWSAGYIISSVPQGGKFYYVEEEQKLLKDGAVIYFQTYWMPDGVCALIVRKSVDRVKSEGFSADDVVEMSCWRPKVKM